MGAVLAAKALLNPPMLLREISKAAEARPSSTVTSMWRWWFGITVLAVLASITFFLVLEFMMLAQGRPQDTLSAQVWRILGAQKYVPVGQWSATRVLLLIAWLTMWVFVDLVVVWLTGHFWWHAWH